MIQTIYEPWATNSTINSNNNLYVPPNENFTVGLNSNGDKSCWLNSSLSMPPEQRLNSLNELVSKIVEDAKPLMTMKSENELTKFNDFNDYDESVLPYFMNEGTITPPTTITRTPNNLTTTSSLSSSPLTNVNIQQQQSSSSSTSSTSSIEPQVHQRLQNEFMRNNNFNDTPPVNKLSNSYQMSNKLYCEICKTQYSYINTELVRCLCGYKNQSTLNENNCKMVKVSNGQNGNNGLQTIPLKEFRRMIGLRDNFKRDYTPYNNNNHHHYHHESNNNYNRSAVPNRQRFMDTQKFQTNKSDLHDDDNYNQNFQSFNNHHQVQDKFGNFNDSFKRDYIPHNDTSLNSIRAGLPLNRQRFMDSPKFSQNCHDNDNLTQQFQSIKTYQQAQEQFNNGFNNHVSQHQINMQSQSPMMQQQQQRQFLLNNQQQAQLSTRTAIPPFNGLTANERQQQLVNQFMQKQNSLSKQQLNENNLSSNSNAFLQMQANNNLNNFSPIMPLVSDEFKRNGAVNDLQSRLGEYLYQCLENERKLSVKNDTVSTDINNNITNEFNNLNLK